MNNIESYTFSTLSKHPLYKEKVIKLIEKSFDYKEEHSFEIDFYPLINENNFAHNYILLDGENLIAHIGVKIRTLKFQEGQTKVALLGGIAIDPKYRGQGLFAPFFTKVRTQEQKVSLYILWSNLIDLYNKNGFFLAGGQIVNKATQNQLPLGYTRTLLQNLTQSEYSEVKELYQEFLSQCCSLERTDKDWLELKKITSSSLYIKKDGEHKKIISYYFKDKGHDLNNTIHELGFQSPLKDKTIREFKNSNIWLSEDNKNLFEDYDLTYMCMMRVGDQKLFKDFIESWSSEAIIINQIDLESIEFTFDEKVYKEKHQEFLQYLFGPNPIKEFEEVGPRIFICGLDSI